MASSLSCSSSDTQLESMQEELERLTKQEEQLKRALAKKDLELQISEKKRSITMLENQLDTSTIAFTAVVTRSELKGLGRKQTILFDKVLTNVGNAYNALTGIFTAPIGGVYTFNMDIMEAAGNCQYLEFVKDGEHLMWNYLYAGSAQPYAASSRCIVIELKTGNQVWVRTQDTADHGTGKIWGNGFSSFSGWLISPNK